MPTVMDVISTVAGTALLQREKDSSLYVLLVICDRDIVFSVKEICSEGCDGARGEEVMVSCKTLDMKCRHRRLSRCIQYGTNQRNTHD